MCHCPASAHDANCPSSSLSLPCLCSFSILSSPYLVVIRLSFVGSMAGRRRAKTAKKRRRDRKGSPRPSVVVVVSVALISGSRHEPAHLSESGSSQAGLQSSVSGEGGAQNGTRAVTVTKRCAEPMRDLMSLGMKWELRRWEMQVTKARAESAHPLGWPSKTTGVKRMPF